MKREIATNVRFWGRYLHKTRQITDAETLSARFDDFEENYFHTVNMNEDKDKYENY